MFNRSGITRTVFLFIVLAFSGCAGLQPLPHAARSGDTIALAVGSPEGMTRENTTIRFVSDAAPGTLVDLTDNITAIFKVAPDKLSRVAMDSGARSIPANSGHEPYLGVVSLDLPNGLPLGTGSLTINTTAENPVGSGVGDELTVALDILPGSGEPNPLAYMHNEMLVGGLSDLESIGHCELRPEFDPASPGSFPLFGSVDINVRIVIRSDTGDAVDDNAFAVVFQDMGGDTGSQLQAFWNRDGDILNVHFVSPGGMQLFEPRFAIVPKPGTVIQDVNYPAATYHDLDGLPVSGPPIKIFLNGEEALVA